MHQVTLPRNFVDRFGRRVLTDEGQPGRDVQEGLGATTEQRKVASPLRFVPIVSTLATPSSTKSSSGSISSALRGDIELMALKQ